MRTVVRLFIHGEWADASDGRTLAVENPATGQEFCRVACATTADLDRAVRAAQDGFGRWKKIPAVERAAIMRRAAVLMRERVEAIAPQLVQEQGKPLQEARTEVLAAADIIEWFADEGQRVYGRIVPSRNPRAQQMVVKDPVGPVAAFTPWNFPITQVVRKVAAALAAGCSILVKGPEETPASPAELVRAFSDAGVPAGVLGLVYGDPVQISRHLIAHPLIRKVTFTGSTAVGKLLAEMAGRHMKRVTMELGGHAPFIVAQDADVDLAVQVATRAKFRNAGQVCISPTRFLVHEAIRPAFVTALANNMRSLKVGNGLDEGVQMGPLANPRRVSAMLALTADALQHGAQAVVGGEALDSPGNFFQPTLLDKVRTDSRLFNEEPFGPILGVQGFHRLEDAIAEANRLAYGLAGYAFTESLKSARLLSETVEVGMLWINQAAAPAAELPFGGLKDSGYGSEGGMEALEAHLNTRLVSIATA